jgi:hypothetical protein
LSADRAGSADATRSADATGSADATRSADATGSAAIDAHAARARHATSIGTAPTARRPNTTAAVRHADAARPTRSHETSEAAAAVQCITNTRLKLAADTSLQACRTVVAAAVRPRPLRARRRALFRGASDGEKADQTEGKDRSHRNPR